MLNASKKNVIRAKDIWNAIEVKILRELNLISASKQFGSNECQLCIQERTHIAKAELFKLSLHTNRNIEIFGPCRHKAKFIDASNVRLLTNNISKMKQQCQQRLKHQKKKNA